MTNARIKATNWKMSWAQSCEMSQMGRAKGVNWLQLIEKACASGLIRHNTPSTLTLKEYELIRSTLENL